MLSIIDPGRIAANLTTLADALEEVRRGSVRQRYLRCLSRLQDSPWRPKDARRMTLQFGASTADQRALRDRFLVATGVPEGRPHTPGERTQIRRNIALALYALGDRRERAVRLLIDRIVLVTTPVFASLSSPLGVIICGPGADWPTAEYGELVLHEAVHQALFVEDMIAGLFARPIAELAAQENRVLNPVLGEQRPFDMAFHGAMVAAVLTELYLVWGDLPRARAFGAPLLVSVPALATRAAVLEERGLELLTELQRFVQSCPALTDVDPEHIAHYARDPDTRQSHLRYPAIRAELGA